MAGFHIQYEIIYMCVCDICDICIYDIYMSYIYHIYIIYTGIYIIYIYIWYASYVSYVSYATYIYNVYIYIIYIYIMYMCILYRSVCLFLFGRICFTSSEEGHLLEILSPFNEFGKFDEFGPRWRSNSMGPISESYSSSLWVNDSHKGSKLVILPQCIPNLPPLYLWYLEQPSSEFDIEKLMRQVSMATKNKAPMKPRIWLKVVVRHPTKWVKRILHLPRIIEISNMLFVQKL